MISGLWGIKIGMTQVFAGDKVVPVTAIDVANWVVTAVQTQEKNGYLAIQLGCIRKRYADQPFANEWLQKPSLYFGHLKEVRLTQIPDNLVIGQPLDLEAVMTVGDMVDVAGKTRGRGFAGVVKRHGFAGARASHGATMGKRPGALSWMRAHGRVIKGKKLPGHMGNKRRMMGNLEVVRVEKDSKVLLVKGSIPGHSGSLVFVRKSIR
jgi:large subunit ribosomal protein L3